MKTAVKNNINTFFNVNYQHILCSANSKQHKDLKNKFVTFPRYKLNQENYSTTNKEKILKFPIIYKLTND